MSEYLLSLSVGPVQEFIAAARRTADLYAGSRLLQTVAAAAADALPPPGSGPAGSGRIFPVDPHAGGANKILAVVPDPVQAAAAAEDAARAAFRGAWEAALEELPLAQQRIIDLGRATAQIGSFLEVYAAWLPTTVAGYPQDRANVERLLAGRKALRDFPQQPADDAGIANSALDPSRPNVVTGPYRSRVPQPLQGRPLYLKSTEMLDAVSLLKRLRGRSLGPVLSTRDLAQRALTPGSTSSGDDVEVEPDYPYFAILVADGDRMGRLISEVATIDGHRDLARALDAFTADAAEVVEAADGQLVYCGGDDVLALVPVTEALDCAELLADAFASHVPAGTLSVGVAVVHYRDPLSLSLTRARAAEALAKQHRNALAVAVHTRGGDPLHVTEPWPATTMRTWLAHTRQGRVSRGLAHELRRLARAWPPTGSPGALHAETRRTIEHTQPHVAGSVVNDLPPLTGATDLDGFADLLILARFLTTGGLPR